MLLSIIVVVATKRLKARIDTNGETLGEEADLKVQTSSLAQKPIESTNVQYSTKPAFLPNVC